MEGAQVGDLIVDAAAEDVTKARVVEIRVSPIPALGDTLVVFEALEGNASYVGRRFEATEQMETARLFSWAPG